MLQPYRFAPGVMLRAPLYSFQQYDPGQLEVLLGTLTFRNALFLASPAFYRIIETKQFDYARLSEKERYGLLRYYNRMSFRATPFGAFASVSLLTWQPGEQPAELTGDEGSQLHLLPGQEVVTLLLEAAPLPAADEPLMLNPTLYQAGGQFRYIKSSREPGGTKYQFALTAVAAEPLTVMVRALLAGGSRPAGDVLALVTTETGAKEAEAADYLEFLLSEQCLFSCRQGSVLESGEAMTLAAALVPIGARSWFACWPDRQTVALDLQPSLAKAAAAIMDSARLTTVAERGLYYGGLERKVLDGGVPAADQARLLGAVDTLQRLTLPPPMTALETFISAFRERFEQQEVPLLVALDPDLGVGYGHLQQAETTGWLQGIPYQSPVSEDPARPWTAVHQFFMQKWLKNTQHRPDTPLILDAEEISALPLPQPELALPPGMALMYSRYEDQLLLEHAGGASATSLMGRFSAFSPEIAQLCRDIAQAEALENTDIIFADIHQLTDSHIDNINRRRAIYPAQLPINTWNPFTREQTIELADLHLKLYGTELVLFSQSLGKRVIPRLTTAFNALHNGLGVFRLLFDLQYQGLRHQLNFDLELLFPGLTHYPRVVAGGVILAPAKWIFQQPVIAGLCRRPFSLGRLHQFVAQHHLPALLTLGLGDQQLTFDLGDDRQALFFLDCISRLPRMILHECLLSGAASVQVGGQPHQGQYVAALLKTGITYGRLPLERSSSNRVAREFLMGSEWLYLKLFCTPMSGNILLREVIHPVVQEFASRISTWFFIRYADPAPHLRLRFRLDGPEIAALLLALRDHMSAGDRLNLVRDYQGDTYRRELERYGQTDMELIETAFESSSNLVLAWLARPEDTAAKDFPLFALFTVNLLAMAFWPQNEALKDFFGDRATALRREYAEPAATKRLQDGRYREMSGTIRAWLEGTEAGRLAPELLAAMESFERKAALVAQATEGRDAHSRESLLADLIHMHVNRLFPADQRQHEALICHLLFKYHSYRVATRQ